jgi:hypothetical protein
MNARSGVFTKYIIEFLTPSLKVSNDLLAGDMCIDADVWVRMSRGAAGASFEITLYDLPEPRVRALADAVGGGDSDASPLPISIPGVSSGGGKPHLRIKLGYFDTKTETVLEGVCESVDCEAGEDRLVTTIKGRESAFFACAQAPYNACLSGNVAFEDAIREVMSTAKFPKDCLDLAPQLSGLPTDNKLHNPRFNSRKVLGVLDEIVQRANAELLLIDRKVIIGSPIRYGDKDIEIDRAVNLAKFQPLRRAIPSDEDLNFPDPIPAADMEGFRFTVTGDATMRPGQKVIVKNVKNYDAAANPEFRIRQVEHRYSASGGYTCTGVATRRLKDGARARQLDAAAERSAHAAARSVADRVRSQAFENPAVEVAAIKRAGSEYTADVYYGQASAGHETRPSINAPVRPSDDQIYESMPIASMFAWRKCGLVTPVYPGMKAVVVHNRSMASDGIIGGYIWSKDPAFAPPPNKPGDWWLCLPIDVSNPELPDDFMTVVNDLTAADGCRVIELKGLKITVGAAGLAGVGSRPTPGDPEVCTIAHASGSVVTIKKNEIEVDNGTGSKITLGAAGITMTDGKLNVRLGNGQLAIG